MDITRCDKKGRIYLKQALRRRFGEKFFIWDTPDGLRLVSVPEDPVRDLQELLAPLRKIKTEELKARILKRARDDVLNGLR